MTGTRGKPTTETVTMKYVTTDRARGDLVSNRKTERVKPVRSKAGG